MAKANNPNSSTRPRVRNVPAVNLDTAPAQLTKDVTLSAFVIEDNVPFKSVRPRKECPFPFATMLIDQSFSVALTDPRYKQVANEVNRYNRENPVTKENPVLDDEGKPLGPIGTKRRIESGVKVVRVYRLN